MKYILVFVVLCAHVLAGVEGTNFTGDFYLYRDAMKFLESCGIKHLSLCLKEKALKYVDNLPNNLDLGGGFKITSDPDRSQYERKIPVTLPEEVRAKEETLDNIIFDRIAEYIGSHTLEFRFPSDRSAGAENEIGEGRKKKRGGGMKMKSMIMLLQLKATALGAILLKIIGLVAFKALMVAKVALLISGVVALKKLANSNHQTSTYEIVAHPYEEHTHYDRALEIAPLL